MSKHDTRHAHDENRPRQQVWPVPVSFEIVKFEKDVLSVGPDGHGSVGNWIDKFIESASEHGDVLGELKVDLRQLTTGLAGLESKTQ